MKFQNNIRQQELIENGYECEDRSNFEEVIVVLLKKIKINK